MKTVKSLILALLVLLSSPSLSGQSTGSVVKGRVLDASSGPLPGVVVYVRDGASESGTMTDENGDFRLDVKSSDVIVFSCMGYRTVEKKVSEMPAGKWSVVMEEEQLQIEETVVVGYGVQKRESVVGAITNIKNDDLIKSGTSSLNNSLAGKVPGLTVFSESGAPGENDATLLVRGLSSWNGNAPLVMVDGIEREMSTISPNDVQSISVLKDASATAVYGAKGANGVILVTTKTGAKGAPRFSAKVEQGVNTPRSEEQHV